MIEISHVYKSYGDGIHALKNIDLFIEKGEFVFLTGPSGAGKSTLFRLITALENPTSGTIQVGPFLLNSLTQQKLPYFRRQIGIVFQDFRLLKKKSVFENVAISLLVKGEKNSFIEKRVRDVLDQVDLGNKAQTPVEYLSGGEQQRTAIARALAPQPLVLIADEPTGNLDPLLSEDIMDVFERVTAQGTTLFIATHDHEMVKRRNKRVVHLQNGLLAKEGLAL